MLLEELLFVIVGLALIVLVILALEVSLSDPLRVGDIEKLAETLLLSVMLVESDAVTLLINVEVVVAEIVEDDVNVVLLEMLGETLTVALTVVAPLIDKLWLVDGDVVIESVPEDVTDTLVVAETLPEWDALVVALWDDDTVKLRLTDKECDADAVIDNDEVLLAEMLLVVVIMSVIVFVTLVLDDSV